MLNRNFFMLPSVAKSHVPDVLSAANVATLLFVDVPEMRVNSANKFFDALASGTPVAINYGGWQATVFAKARPDLNCMPQFSNDLQTTCSSLEKFFNVWLRPAKPRICLVVKSTAGADSQTNCCV